MTSRTTKSKLLEERIAKLEAENERRLDELRRLLSIVQSQSELLQQLVMRP